MKKRIKILFIHFDLGNGGAERVLINLLHKLDHNKYDITLKTIFSGHNCTKLPGYIKFKPLFNRSAFRGMSRVLRVISPSLLYKWFVREDYDIEIAYLEQIPTRILGGGRRNLKTKKFAWVHNTTDCINDLNGGIYRSTDEMIRIYSSYDKIAFVSKGAEDSFNRIFGTLIDSSKYNVVHNVNNFDQIKELSTEDIPITLEKNVVNLCSIGRLCGQKGYDRLIKSLGRISNNGITNWHLYLLGSGPEYDSLRAIAETFNISKKITFLGFQTNPYKYLAKMDFFVCSSTKEGYSTAVTEAMILGIPILTTNCSGMDEIIDQSNAGLIVGNSEVDLENGLMNIITLDATDLCQYKHNALLRGTELANINCIDEFESFVCS